MNINVKRSQRKHRRQNGINNQKNNTYRNMAVWRWRRGNGTEMQFFVPQYLDAETFSAFFVVQSRTNAKYTQDNATMLLHWKRSSQKITNGIFFSHSCRSGKNGLSRPQGPLQCSTCKMFCLCIRQLKYWDGSAVYSVSLWKFCSVWEPLIRELGVSQAPTAPPARQGRFLTIVFLGITLFFGGGYGDGL